MRRHLSLLALALAMGLLMADPALADWERLPGQATDIAVAGRDHAFCIGANRTDGGGYGVWRWDGGDWRALGGAGVRIGADRGGVWVVNSQGGIWRWSGGWTNVDGQATDIACGGGQVWAIGAGRESGGYGIFHWNGRGWDRVPGAAVRIAVDDRGAPWVVNDRGDIFRHDGRDWRALPGQAVDIAVGGGNAFVLGHRRTAGGFEVYQWTGGGWRAVGGSGVAIAVDGAGRPWLCNDRGDIFRWR